MKYCIWNNKGGVGKTFLTYTIATEYAIKNPKTCIVVADMCPQANISEMLLGGNGDGSANLNKIYEENRTVSHYIAGRLKNNPYTNNLLGDEISYYIDPSIYNNKIPNNIRLIAGSSDLDLYAKGIEWIANSGKMTNQPKSWEYVKSWLKSLLDMYPPKLDKRYDKCVFFIDCNPSFSSYTELALVAADKLIVPCTADGASVRALNNVIKIIYGIGARDEYIASFSNEMTANKMVIPRISMIIQNRNRTKTTKEKLSGKKQTSEAFSGVRDEVREEIKKYISSNPDIFSNNSDIVVDVKDCNAIAPIISYNGEIMSRLNKGAKYKVYKKNATASGKQVEAFQVDINDIVNKI